jgi:hypothetical protein
VHLVVRLDDGSQLEAAVTSVEHPGVGDRVVVEIDPAGVVDLSQNVGREPIPGTTRRQSG